MVEYFIDFGGGYKLLPNQIIEYNAVDQDYDVDATRTVSGRLFRNRVAMIPEVTFTVRPLSQLDMTKLMNVLTLEQFTVTFYHSALGEYKTAEFYCGPSSRKIKMRRQVGGSIMYDAHTFTLTGIHNAR